MTTLVQPLHDKIYIAEAKREVASPSGIIIQGAGNADTAFALALAIGPAVTEVKTGDRLVVDWSKASAVTIDGIQRAVIKEADVIAVVEE